MIVEIVALAGAAAGGTYAFFVGRRARAHARWKRVLEEVAKKLGGRASPATMFDAPELRINLYDVTVTLKLREIHRPEKGVAIAEARIMGLEVGLRLYLGWDVLAPPEGLEHVPDVDYGGAAFVEGKVVVRGSDPAIARRFVELAAIDLVDLRREANARAMEVVVRGGYLELRAHGMQESPHMVERLAIVSGRLVKQAIEAAGGASPSAKPAPVLSVPAAPATATGGAGAAAGAVVPACTLCMSAKKTDESWVRCKRCGAPYHQACWQQATGCLVEGCDETLARPLEPT